LRLFSQKSFSILAAAAVHSLTASGAVLGLLALLAASEGRWEASFAWLGVALCVDGVDGPLARLVDVKRVLPRFSGEELDHLVDYLTYVAVPAYMVARSGVAPEGLRLWLAGVIMLVSLYHFSDTQSKTPEGYFVGFPAIWNAIVLYCFVLDLPPSWSAALIALCAVLTFVPLYWLHPLRVRRLRLVTIGVMFAWGVAAAAAIAHGFPGTLLERSVFILTALYTVGIGLSAGGSTRFGSARPSA
jgi:phosphatidylcholine synthase